MVLWCYGVMVLWCYDAMMLWYYGAKVHPLGWHRIENTLLCPNSKLVREKFSSRIRNCLMPSQPLAGELVAALLYYCIIPVAGQPGV